MTGPRVVSTIIPYVPIAVTAGSPPSVFEFTALVDTGFTGYVVVPRGTFTNSNPPWQYLPWILADGSTITAPAYRGTVRIGSTDVTAVVIVELGDEATIGMQLISFFTLTIDHGHVLIFEP